MDTGEEASERVWTPGARVLVVDDEPMVIEVLARYLSSEKGSRVAGRRRRARGDHAGSMTTQPDLVLLDLMLPTLDGYEVFRQIRERGFYTP